MQWLMWRHCKCGEICEIFLAGGIAFANLFAIFLKNSSYGHQSGITSIDALSRERCVTSGGADQSVRIWKITESSQLLFNGHGGNIETVKLINEENFLSSSDNG